MVSFLHNNAESRAPEAVVVKQDVFDSVLFFDTCEPHL